MIKLCAQLKKMGKSFIEAGQIVLQQVRKDSRVWMCNMTRHELMQKAAPVVEKFIMVMHREERSGMGHTWLKGNGYQAHQANLATLGSHTSSDWDSNGVDSSINSDDGDFESD